MFYRKKLSFFFFLILLKIISTQEEENIEKNQEDNKKQQIQDSFENNSNNSQQQTNNLYLQGYYKALIEYDTLNKWNFCSNHFLPRSFYYNLKNDYFSCSEKDLFEEFLLSGKYHIKYDVLLQRTPLRMINNFSEIKNKLFDQKGTFLQEYNNERKNEDPEIQQELNYFLQKAIEKQFLHDLKEITITAIIYVSAETQFVGVFDKIYFYYDEDDEDDNFMTPPQHDFQELFKNESVSNHKLVQIKSIITYTLLALHEKNIIQDIFSFQQNYFFEFKLDWELHPYIYDVTSDYKNPPNTKLDINQNTALVFLRDKNESKTDLIFLNFHQFQQIFEKPGYYFQEFKTPAVYYQKNDVLVANYFSEREDFTVITNRSCTYQNADWIFGRQNLNFSLINNNKQVFNRLPNQHFIVDLQELQTLLNQSDYYKIQTFKSTDFLPETRIFDCREKPWSSFEEVDYIQNKDRLSQTASDNQKWILKREIGSNYQIFLTFSELIEKLRQYKGRIKESITLQKLITNPIILSGKKVDFKVFMLVVSSSPFIVLFKKGFIRQNKFDYDLGQINSQFCARKIPDKNSTQTQTQNQYSCNILTFETFKSQMMQEYDISDQRLNQIYDRIKAALTYVLINAKFHLDLKKNYIQIFEATFIVDMQLNVQLINIKDNYTPKDSNKQLRNFYAEMIEDWLDIAIDLKSQNWVWNRKLKEKCRQCTVIFNENSEFQYEHFLRTYEDSFFKSKKLLQQKNSTNSISKEDSQQQQQSQQDQLKQQHKQEDL